MDCAADIWHRLGLRSSLNNDMSMIGAAMAEVLCLISYFSPGFKAGGALRSVENICVALKERCDIAILTSDRDLGDAGRYPGIAPNCWTPRAGVRVFYSDRSLRTIVQALAKSEASTLYLNSFFDPRFSILPLIWSRLFGRRRRIVLAPRGEFSPGALELKAMKKRAYLALAKWLRLYKGIQWHVSTPVEAAELSRVLPVRPEDIHVVRDLVAPRQAIERPILEHSPLKICFVSRISPKKNLLYAIKVVLGADRPIVFDIYGPKEDQAYFEDCRDAVSAATGKEVKISFWGAVSYDEVPTIFARYHLFLLPTLGENFGHVVAEALASGTPVLISDQTPWRNLAEEKIGWDLPLSQPEAFIEAVRRVADMPPSEYETLRERAAAYRFGVDDNVAEDSMYDLLFPPDKRTDNP